MPQDPSVDIANQLIRQIVLPGGLGQLHPGFGRINLVVRQDPQHFLRIDLGRFMFLYAHETYTIQHGAFALVSQFTVDARSGYGTLASAGQTLCENWTCETRTGQPVTTTGTIDGRPEAIVEAVTAMLQAVPWQQPFNALSPGPVATIPPVPLPPRVPEPDPAVIDRQVALNLQRQRLDEEKQHALHGRNGLCECYILRLKRSLSKLAVNHSR